MTVPTNRYRNIIFSRVAVQGDFMGSSGQLLNRSALAC